MLDPYASQPPPEDKFKRWFIGTLLFANAVIVATGVSESGIGVYGAPLFYGLPINLGFVALGGLSTFFLKRKSPTMSLYRHLGWVIGGPIVAFIGAPITAVFVAGIFSSLLK